MQTALPLFANILIASCVYFGFIVMIGSREIGDAVLDALVFAAIYGAVKIGFYLYRKGKQ
ncbi:hypothetical protein L0666_03765 [Octadecabacter sp. CECT 8868]|uniref:hypothetical protein n=1 Tax=Octadecabacter algicola TaxID=2909342 RepID=UPI001F2DCC56|nr:hypothetical protein [Octadecabacter algicola]MCF2904094.1 hypothetical protein [Octadecabacter algicola]